MASRPWMKEETKLKEGFSPLRLKATGYNKFLILLCKCFLLVVSFLIQYIVTNLCKIVIPIALAFRLG